MTWSEWKRVCDRIGGQLPTGDRAASWFFRTPTVREGTICRWTRSASLRARFGNTRRRPDPTDRAGWHGSTLHKAWPAHPPRVRSGSMSAPRHRRLTRGRTTDEILPRGPVPPSRLRQGRDGTRHSGSFQPPAGSFPLWPEPPDDPHTSLRPYTPAHCSGTLLA